MINPDGTISQVPAGGAPQAPAWGQFGGARPQQPMAPSQPPAAPAMAGSGVMMTSSLGQTAGQPVPPPAPTMTGTAGGPARPTMTGTAGGVQQAAPSSAMVQPRTPQPAGQAQPQSLGNYLRGGMSASGAIGSPTPAAPAAPSGAAGFGVSQPGSSGNGLNSFMHGNFSPLGPTSNWNPVKRWLGF